MAIFNISFKQFLSKMFSKETPSLETLTLFTQQLTVIFDSGIPIVRALAALTDGAAAGFKNVLKNIIVSLVNGFSLSSALSKHPHVFPPYYIAIIGAAELSGEMSRNLKLLVKLLERSVWFKRKIIGSLVYPVMVLLGAILITGVLLFWMVPPFLEMFALYKVELPLPTRILIWITGIAKIPYFWWGVGILGVTLLGYIFLFPQSSYDYFLTFIGRIPAVGRLMYVANYAWFSRLFSSLFRSGVSMLVIFNHLVRHRFTMAFHEVILEVKNNVNKGENLSSAFELSGHFTSMFVWLVRVGESTGKLVGMFEYLANMYEDDLEQKLSAALTMIEPFLMLFLGGVVGFIVVACFLPMYSLIGQLK